MHGLPAKFNGPTGCFLLRFLNESEYRCTAPALLWDLRVPSAKEQN